MSITERSKMRIVLLWFLSLVSFSSAFGSFDLFKEWQKVTEYEINHFITTEADMFERWIGNDKRIREHNAWNHS